MTNLKEKRKWLFPGITPQIVITLLLTKTVVQRKLKHYIINLPKMCG